MSVFDRVRALLRSSPLSDASEGASLLVREGIAREELAGQRLMFRARLIVLCALGAFLLAWVPFERSSQYVAALVVFALLGAPPYLLARRGLDRTWITAGFLALDVALLTYLLIVPTDYATENWTMPLNLRLPSFLYLGVFLVGISLCYSPGLVIWAGIAAVASWSAGFLWVAFQPGSVLHSASAMLDGPMERPDIVAQYLDPNSVSLTGLTNQIVFLVLITGLLALGVWRSRSLVRRQVAAEQARGALSRYFSPNIVAELEASGGALGKPARQPAGILFADIVGFTTMSERMEPEALVAMLQEFHRRLAQTVFAHDGTIDKYIGDSVMVHFGTPHPRDDDPLRALRCACAMIDEIDAWNRQRSIDGLAPLRIGIGLHFGEVLVGNIGDARRLEYTALGDTVNVAERLERLTRDLGVTLVASDDLIAAVRDRGLEEGELLRRLTRIAPQPIRGRSGPIDVWVAS